MNSISASHRHWHLSMQCFLQIKAGEGWMDFWEYKIMMGKLKKKFFLISREITETQREKVDRILG